MLVVRRPPVIFTVKAVNEKIRKKHKKMLLLPPNARPSPAGRTLKAAPLRKKKKKKKNRSLTSKARAHTHTQKHKAVYRGEKNHPNKNITKQTGTQAHTDAHTNTHTLTRTPSKKSRASS
jgi:hypothetical protein